LSGEAQEALKDRILEESREAHLPTLERKFKIEAPFPNVLARFAINEEYREIARALCKKYPDALTWARVYLDQIIFLENTVDEPQANGDYKRAAAVKIPPMFQSILRQFTDHHFEYVIVVYTQNCIGITPAKLAVLLWHQLRHIGAEGKLISHHIQEFSEIVAAFGSNWFHLDIPDLLAPGVTWENAIPRSLFEEPAQLPKAESDKKQA
jgi:hypothetical protein